MIRVVILVLIAGTLLGGRANANGTFCAAEVSRVVAVHSLTERNDLGTDTDFAYEIRGLVATEVSGTLDIYAGGDLYSVPFSNVQLKKRAMQWLDPSTRKTVGDYTEVESDPLYFHFDAAKTVQAVWIATAANPSTVVDCPTMPIAARRQSESSPVGEPVGGRSEAELRMMFPERPPKATLTAHVDSRGCAAVMEPAKSINLVPPEPVGTEGHQVLGTLIKLLLDSSGKIVDLSIFASSGSMEFDQASVRAARRSTFAPARFLCIAVPARYTFLTRYSP
ncbi:MAG: energy transducer TonB [Candidatus Baltobacteraceae bacterium]